MSGIRLRCLVLTIAGIVSGERACCGGVREGLDVPIGATPVAP